MQKGKTKNLFHVKQVSMLFGKLCYMKNNYFMFSIFCIP